jgi:hypothetical protein
VEWGAEAAKILKAEERQISSWWPEQMQYDKETVKGVRGLN